MTSPEQSNPPGEAPAHDVRRAEVLTSRRRRRRRSSTAARRSRPPASRRSRRPRVVRDRPASPARACTSATRACAARRGAQLARLLLGDQPLHLAVRATQSSALALAELRLDRAAAAARAAATSRSTCASRCASARAVRACTAVLEQRHLDRDLGVDRRDPVLRCRSASGSRRGSCAPRITSSVEVEPRRVERDEALRDRLLARARGSASRRRARAGSPRCRAAPARASCSRG